MLRHVAFSTGAWKNLLDAHWGFARHGHACVSAPRYSPDPWVLALLTALCRGGYMEMTPMNARMVLQAAQLSIFQGRVARFCSGSDKVF